jgi:antitoxin (DNA-binding transcriptional repressor) of toxin-antitoxin stability system
MLAVGIKQLKNKLSEYLRLVSLGETVLITDRERVVAELRAPSNPSVNVSVIHLAELVEKGLVRPPLSPPGTTSRRLPRRMPLEQLLADLSEDRSER